MRMIIFTFWKFPIGFSLGVPQWEAVRRRGSRPTHPNHLLLQVNIIPPMLHCIIYYWRSNTFLPLKASNLKKTKYVFCLSALFFVTESMIATWYYHIKSLLDSFCHNERLQFSRWRSPRLLGDGEPLHEQILPGDHLRCHHCIIKMTGMSAIIMIMIC